MTETELDLPALYRSDETTVACVWATDRIFRVGFLMQRKSPKLKDIGRWIVKG